jgi:beta-fructofuranosidase/levanase/fructan beta-fructosidase
MMNRKLLVSVVLGGVSAAGFGAEVATYQEPFRPQFHFTPAKNWMNDPNGMVYYEGEYHLFYQYNPFGDKWGHMSWGHAVSPDMVHWKHLPVALYEENDIMIFSGSAVVDWKNTSGFGKDGKPPLVAIYTGHYTKKPLQDQQIAYSNDRGRTWTKYEGNPVLDIGEKDFRDPKVMWHEGTKRWVMTVAWPVERKVRFYASPNLKEWEHLSDFGPAGSTKGIWECPDLFPLPAKGGKERWVLIVNVGSEAPAGGSGCQYFVGDFDGKKFELDVTYPKPEGEFVPEGRVLADFEGGYGDWKATGNAFGNTPARGTLPNQQAVDGFRGQGLVNSYLNGDQTRGTLTSPEFEITKDFLSFLIGGGNHPGRTGISLSVDGRTVRIATGDNAERLAWKNWDVREFRGRRGQLEIFDQETGGWGHINVDHIVMADRPARGSTETALWADYGPDFYAAVSWSDIPKRDGRRLWLGWMSGWPYANDVPTSPWRSAMSVPRALELRETGEGLRMVQEPVRELEKLRGERFRKRNADVGELNQWLEKIVGGMWEVELEVEPGDAGFGLKFFVGENQETELRWDAKRKVLVLDRRESGRTDFSARFSGVFEAPVELEDGRLRLKVLLDVSSIEVFADGGEKVITALVFPNEVTKPMEFWSENAAQKVRRFTAWKLKAAVPILEEKAGR